MALQPNKQNNSLNISGSNLFNWKSKPLQPTQRQPSGASAPRSQSDIYGTTRGVSNNAGIPKQPDPLAGFAREALRAQGGPDQSSIMRNEARKSAGFLSRDKAIYGFTAGPQEMDGELPPQVSGSRILEKLPYKPSPGGPVAPMPVQSANQGGWVGMEEELKDPDQLSMTPLQPPSKAVWTMSPSGHLNEIPSRPATRGGPMNPMTSVGDYAVIESTDDIKNFYEATGKHLGKKQQELGLIPSMEERFNEDGTAKKPFMIQASGFYPDGQPELYASGISESHDGKSIRTDGLNAKSFRNANPPLAQPKTDIARRSSQGGAELAAPHEMGPQSSPRGQQAGPIGARAQGGSYENHIASAKSVDGQIPYNATSGERPISPMPMQPGQQQPSTTPATQPKATPQPQSAQENHWQGIPSEYKARYDANVAAGKTKMSPGDASEYYWENYYQPKDAPGEIPMGTFAPDGTHTKNQWAGVPADFVERYEFNRWRGDKDALRMTPKQAADIYHRDYAPSGKGLDPLNPSLEGEFADWQGDTTGGWKGKMTSKPAPTPAATAQPSIQSSAAPNSSSPASQSNKPTEQGTRMLPGSGSASKPSTESQIAFGNLELDGKPLPPLSRKRFDQLNAESEMERALLKKSVNDSRGNLGFTGAIQNDSYVDSLNKKADYYGERRASADAMNEHQAAGGGLQASNRQLANQQGILENEINRRDAGILNAATAREKAQRDAYNAQQDAMMARHKDKVAADNKAYETDMGIKDMSKTKQDLARLNAEYYAMNKSGAGMKFTDFVQAKVDRDEIDKDSLAVISKNYGVEFEPANRESAASTAYGQGLQLTADRRAADKAARDAGYVPGMNQAQRKALDASREIGAQEAAQRRDAARLMSQGMSPQQANQALAQDKARKDYYGAVAASQGNSADAMARMYQANLGFMEGKLDREDRREQRDFDKEQTRRSQDADFAARAMEANNGEDPYQPGTKANRDMENMKRVRDGLPPIPAPVSQRVIDKVERDGLVNDSPESILSVMREARESGATEDQQREIIGKSFGADLKNPIEAGKVLGKVLSNIRDSMIEAAKKNSGLLKNGNSAFYEAEDIGNRNYGDVINLLYKSMPKEAAEKILQEHAKEVEAARKQYSDSSAYRNSGIIWLKQQLDNMF